MAVEKAGRFARLLGPLVGFVLYLTVQSIRALGDLVSLRRHELRRSQPTAGFSRPASESEPMEQPQACESFEVRVTRPHPWQMPLMVVAAVFVGVMTNTPRTYGGRRAVVIDRASGEALAVFTEPWVTDETSRFSTMLQSFETRRAIDLEKTWIRRSEPAG